MNRNLPQPSKCEPSLDSWRRMRLGHTHVDHFAMHLHRRQRTVDTKAEDRKRGQRLFGNLLGTLAKFKGEEKSRGQTERVSTGETHQ
jgi:hypothetical protein